MKPEKYKVLIVILSVVDIVAIVGAIVLGTLPSSAQILTPNASPMMVMLSHPGNNTSWPADTTIPIAVDASGEKAITSLELWVDGTLFDEVTPEFSEFGTYQSWFWVPHTEGKHAFFVRAKDELGRKADSNVIHIIATPASGYIQVITTTGGENLADLAKTNNASLEDVKNFNSNLNPDEPLPAGEEVFIPVNGTDFKPEENTLPANPPGSPADTGNEAKSNGMGLIFEGFFAENKTEPVAPGLTTSVQGCDVKLLIQDNSDPEDGFFIYQLTESDNTFNRIGTLAAHKGTGAVEYVISKQFGQNQFFVSAFNSIGEASSNPTAVDVTANECSKNIPATGGLSYSNGVIHMPFAIQLAYFYASTEGSDWRRVPQGQDYFNPKEKDVDIRKEVKIILDGKNPGKITLDVWGWDILKEEKLVHVGEITLDMNFATLAICNLPGDHSCKGDASSHWTQSAIVGSDKVETSRRFRWSAYGPDITNAIWQISTSPFPNNDSLTAFPGLVLSGNTTDIYTSETGIVGGDFQIDFKNVLNVPTITPVQKDNKFKYGSLWGQKSYDYSSFSKWKNNDYLSVIPNQLTALLTKQLYIRVIPMAGGHPAAEPSNLVGVTFTETGQSNITINKYPAFTIEVLPDTFTPEVNIQQKMGVLGCSIIEAVDHDIFVKNWEKNYPPGSLYGNKFPAEKMYQEFANKISTKVCPPVVELKEESTLETLFEALSQMWNSISNALNSIKSEFVGFIASCIPGCESSCKTLLSTSMNFAITYFTGLPPSIPNFDELMDKGIDYAVQQAITQAGIPYCDSTCQSAISGQIKDATEQLKFTKPQPACSAQASTYWLYENGKQLHLQPLCFPAGVITSPVKGSLRERASVVVHVNRVDGTGFSIPAEYLVVDSFAVNNAYGDGHSQYFSTYLKNESYKMTFNEPLQGAVYPTMDVSVPGIANGQSLDIPVIFDFAPGDFQKTGYPPRTNALKSTFPGQDVSQWIDWDFLDYKHFSDYGTQFTITAHMICQDPTNPKLWNTPCSNTSTLQYTVPIEAAAPQAVPMGQ